MPGSSASRTIGVVVAVVLFVATGPLSAHRRDEYLQAARIDIGPRRVELQLDLTPGIAVADTIASEIDRDRDGRIADAEARSYAAVVMGGLTLQVDGRALEPRLAAAAPPPLDAIATGEGTLRLRFDADMPAGLSPGAHRLTYRNTHHPDIGVYLANALVPESNRVAITGQDRDADQRALTIAFDLGPEHGRGALLAAVAAFGALCAGLALWVKRGGRRRRQPLNFPAG